MQVYSNLFEFTNGILPLVANFKKVITEKRLKQVFVLTLVMFGIGFQAKSQCVDCGSAFQATRLNVDPNFQNSANADYATAGGRYSIADGFSSFAFGGDPNIAHTTADNDYSFAFGQYAETNVSQNSFAFGLETISDESDFSFSFGEQIEVVQNSPYSFAFGMGNRIEGASFSHAFGNGNQIKNVQQTFVFGSGLTITQPKKFVVGWQSDRFFEVNPDVTYSLSDAFGIGTDNPSHKLQVTGGIRLANTNNAQAGAIRWTGSNFEGYDGSSWVNFGAGSTPWSSSTGIIYTSSDDVGIKTSSPATALDVNGTITCNNITTTSDARLKENVESLDNAIDLVNKLEGVTYEFKNENDMKLADDQQYGFIAQEVEKVLPELVNNPEEGYRSLEYQQFTPILTNAIQEQQKQIEEQQQTIKELENRVDRLEAKVQDSRASSQEEGRDASTGARLYDNAPNPFDTETTIRYEVEEGSNASIQVYNMKGEQMKSFTLEEGNKGAITISARTFEPGMYMYSLVAGGEVVDTKRMMITAGE